MRKVNQDGAGVHTQARAATSEASIGLAVVLLLSLRCPYTPADGREHSTSLVVSAVEAVGLLRQHPGPSCRKVAQNLETAWWVVTLAADGLTCDGYVGDEQCVFFWAHYDDPGPCQELLDLVNDRGPCRVRVPDGGTPNVPVYGRDGISAAAAGLLVGVVLSRHVSVPRNGCEVLIKVDDDLLASLLEERYGLHPHAVAEALRTLKSMKGHRDRWLRQVLWGRPELRQLALAVERELTGEG